MYVYIYLYLSISVFLSLYAWPMGALLIDPRSSTTSRQSNKVLGELETVWLYCLLRVMQGCHYSESLPMLCGASVIVATNCWKWSEPVWDFSEMYRFGLPANYSQWGSRNWAILGYS